MIFIKNKNATEEYKKQINKNKIKFIIISICFIYLYNIFDINYNEKKINNLKVCLCLLCKEEKLYIKDFLEYYKKLGFDNIFLYDNNDINGENLKEVIFDYIQNNFVKYINYKDFKSKYGGPQMAAYYDCYQRNNLFYDWIAFFDVDEYLILIPQNLTIQNFLSNNRYNDCESININWRIFTDNNKLDYEKKPLYERFTKAADKTKKANQVTKTIFRGKLLNFSSRKTYNPHLIFYSKKSCDTKGQKINRSYINPPLYDYAILNHYFTKTIKEYINKIRRGHSFYQWKINKQVLDFYFNAFFRYNKKTKEKLIIFNNAFNTKYE